MGLPTSTLKALRQEYIKKLYQPRWPMVSAATSDGSTTTLLDSILSPAAQDVDFIKAWILIISKPTGSASIGEIARVTNVDFSGSTSTLTIAPAMDLAVKDTAEYEIHYKYHPDYAEARINDILDNLETGYLIPLSIIVDGDMEDDPATNFAVGGTETLANDTTYVRRGRQSLKITAGADDDYAQSTSSTYLSGGTQVLCATDCYITAGDAAKIILYDETNGANIEAAESDESGWVHLEFLATTPATCEEVSLRLEAQNSGDVIYFDYATLLPTNGAIITPPGEAEYAHDFGRLFYFPRGTTIAGTTNDYAYKVDEQPAKDWSSYSVQRDDTGVVPIRLEINRTPITRPLFIEADVDFAALTTDTATTTAPANLVVQLALADTYDDMADEEEKMGHTEASEKLRTNAFRTRMRMRNTYTEFRPVRTGVEGAL